MNFVRSKDGTSIAYERAGRGPVLILVDGALCSRSFGPMPALAKLLATHFTVYRYDRRGRGESGDTSPYAIEREIEDLGALIDEAGGTAFVYGVSSGAGLALEAAARGLAIGRLALFEVPFIVDDGRSPIPHGYRAELERLASSGHRGAVVRSFMRYVGMPGVLVAFMRFMPGWSKLTAVAHTVPYDIAIVEDNQVGRPLQARRWGAVTMPTLVLDGGKSPAWMRNAMRSLAGVLPGAQHRSLAGETHMVRPDVVAPELVEFFTAEATAPHGAHA